MLSLHGFTGKRCASAYGEAFRYEIRGFFNREFVPSPLKARYVLACAKQMEKNTPFSYAWCKEMAKGADITLDQAVRFYLHEEDVHAKWRQNGHCTAIVGRTSKGEVLSAENWDWKNTYYQLPNLLRVRPHKGLATLSYAYPGLPFCCGVNEAGLSLVWTGAGYGTVKPALGVPTYALTSEILQKTTLDEVSSLLTSVKNAGAFVFLVGDAKGTCAVFEGIPQKTVVFKGESIYSRSNLFTSKEIIRLTRQRVKDDEDVRLREKAIARYACAKEFTLNSLKSILRTPPVFQQDDLDVMSIDSIISNAKERTLTIARGGNRTLPWKEFSL